MNKGNKKFVKIVKTLGMSDTELAYLLGVSSMTIYRWRTGRSPIKHAALIVAEALANNHGGGDSSSVKG